MKYAIMSDIHCNLVTFYKLIEDAIKNGITNFLFLGDYVTDGYRGNEIIEIIKKLNATAILGNREKYIKNFEEMDSDFNSRLNRKALGYDRLSKDSLNYINTLKETEIIEVNGQKILMIHGDGFDYDNENITNLYDKFIYRYDFDICLSGHTHLQKIDTYKGKTFINPGSVGQPLNNNGFSYCVLEFKENKKTLISYRTIEINSEILNDIQLDFINSKFSEQNPEWCELIMNTISDSYDYIASFMSFLNKEISNYKNLTTEQYNEIFKKKYQEFTKKQFQRKCKSK